MLDHTHDPRPHAATITPQPRRIPQAPDTPRVDPKRRRWDRLKARFDAAQRLSRERDEAHDAAWSDVEDKTPVPALLKGQNGSVYTSAATVTTNALLSDRQKVNILAAGAE